MKAHDPGTGCVVVSPSGFVLAGAVHDAQQKFLPDADAQAMRLPMIMGWQAARRGP